MSTTATPPPTPPSSTSTSTSLPPIPPSSPTIIPTTTLTTSAIPSSSSSSSSTGASSSSSTSNTSSSSTSSSTVSSATSTVPSTSSVIRPSVTTSLSNVPAVVTKVSTTFISESQSSTPTAVAVKNNSFFANKGAVAGVFTVVGLIGLVILIALVVNCIRRRQARKFDKELFLATQEAAATAPNPNFLDDEDDEPKRTGYSDVSHGTYGQPPMEAYNMRDMGSHSTAVGEIYDPYANGGAAGIGVVRARSARANPANAALNPYAAALQEGGSPYPQFAMGPRDTYGAAGGPFGRNNMELGAAIIPSGQQQPPYSQRSPPPQEYTTVGRSKSNSTAATHLSTPSQSHTPNYSQSQVQPSYPVRQMSPPRTTPAPGIPPNPYPPHVHASHEMEPSGGSADDAAYGGYVVDDVEEDVPRRVLKIANES